jgi:hypothetical protein
VLCNHAILNRIGGLASTGKAVDLKSTGPHGPWGFESLALRHLLGTYEAVPVRQRERNPADLDRSLTDVTLAPLPPSDGDDPVLLGLLNLVGQRCGQLGDALA